MKESNNRDCLDAKLNEAILISERAINGLMDIVEKEVLNTTDKELIKKRSKAKQTEVVERLAQDWLDIFGKPPTFFREGPFFKVTRKCLDYIGLPSEDPSRSIKSAIGKLQ